jgi:hypothetical protein
VQSIYEEELVYTDRIRGASIYPAVQNIILACRACGLGTLITTNIRCEGEVKTLLGIPDGVLTYALMPIGYPEDKFGPLKRRPVNEVAFADRWVLPGLVEPLRALERIPPLKIRGGGASVTLSRTPRFVIPARSAGIRLTWMSPEASLRT